MLILKDSTLEVVGDKFLRNVGNYKVTFFWNIAPCSLVKFINVSEKLLQ